MLFAYYLVFLSFDIIPVKEAIEIISEWTARHNIYYHLISSVFIDLSQLMFTRNVAKSTM